MDSCRSTPSEKGYPFGKPRVKVNLLPPHAGPEGQLRRKYAVLESEIRLGNDTFRLLHPSEIDRLIHDAREEDELPFWAYLWPASIGLARYLLQDEQKPGVLEGKSAYVALELGAGVGLAGQAAMRAGWTVIQTDLVPAALQFARVNALRNGLKIPGFVADWRAFGTNARFPLIFGSDILYEPKLHPAMKRLLKNHLLPGGRILISDPCRVYALQFMAYLEDEGARIRVWNAPPDPCDDTHVLIYEVRFP
jgi:predicted nicotinamide N-methyase